MAGLQKLVQKSANMPADDLTPSIYLTPKYLALLKKGFVSDSGRHAFQIAALEYVLIMKVKKRW